MNYSRIMLILLGVLGLVFFFACVLGLIVLPLIGIKADIFLSIVLFFSLWIILYGYKDEPIYFAFLLSIGLHLLPFLSKVHQQEILRSVTAVSLLSLLALMCYNEPRRCKKMS